jgi:hypothetical protein
LARGGNRSIAADVRDKLISTYLATRRGNCVSMPILVLLVGERMGLDLSLSTRRSTSSSATPTKAGAR